MNQAYTDQEIEEARVFADSVKEQELASLARFDKLFGSTISELTGSQEIAEDAVNSFSDEHKLLVMIVIDQITQEEIDRLFSLQDGGYVN